MILKDLSLGQQTNRAFHDAMRKAMGLLDWLVPDHESVVIATSQDDEDIQRPLPKELSDPLAILDRRGRHD